MTQRSSFFEFCRKLNIQPLPLSQTDLGRYIAYLSRRLCFSSVRQYLNVVRIIHLESGNPNPLENNWYVSSILKGVRRVKGDNSSQKRPITIDILKNLASILDFRLSFDRTFWSACLVAFFSFFRKSNLLIQSPESFDEKRHLCATDVQFLLDGAVLTVRWSKTIQFRERILKIPLPKLQNSLFCPSVAVLGITLDCPAPPNNVPLFRYQEKGKTLPLTQAHFTSKLHSCLERLGTPKESYSGHSFRRGGATFALQCGLPVDLIKLQGDWKSNAYERYLEPSFDLRKQVASTMGSHTNTLLRKRKGSGQTT